MKTSKNKDIIAQETSHISSGQKKTILESEKRFRFGPPPTGDKK